MWIYALLKYGGSGMIKQQEDHKTAVELTKYWKFREQQIKLAGFIDVNRSDVISLLSFSNSE